MSDEKPVNAAQIKLFGIKPPSPKPMKPLKPTYHDACMEGKEINLEDHGYKLSPVFMPTPVRFLSIRTTRQDSLFPTIVEAAPTETLMSLESSIVEKSVSESNVPVSSSPFNSQGKEIRRPLSLPAIDEVDESKFSHAELRM